jgi:hypothetical protein
VHKTFVCEVIFTICTMFKPDMFVTPKLHIARDLYACMNEDAEPSVLAIIELGCGDRAYSIIENGFC